MSPPPRRNHPSEVIHIDIVGTLPTIQFMRILLIEDDEEFALYLKKGLEAETFAVDVTPTGARYHFTDLAHQVFQCSKLFGR